MKIALKKYAQLIYESAEEHKSKDALDASLANIAMLIRENRDSGKLDEILYEFEKYCDKQENIIKAKIFSAVKISVNDISDIKKKIAEKFSSSEKKILIEQNVDNKIIGGIVIHVGNEIWDGSVKNKLERLKQSLSV